MNHYFKFNIKNKFKFNLLEKRLIKEKEMLLKDHQKSFFTIEKIKYEKLKILREKYYF